LPDEVGGKSEERMKHIKTSNGSARKVMKNSPKKISANMEAILNSKANLQDLKNLNDLKSNKHDTE